MEFPMHYIRAALAIIFCTGAQAANQLSVTPASVAVTCNTLTGPGPAATIVVKSIASLGSNAISVAPGALSNGLILSAPSPAVLTSANQSQGLAFSISVAPGCSGAVNGAGLIRFFAGGNADASVTVTTSITAQATPLVASPVEVTCGRSSGAAGVYAPGPPQATLLTSAASGGTPFSLDPSTIPAWLALPPTTTKSAGVKAVYIAMSAVAPCGNYPPGSSKSASIHLKNPPAPDGIIPITLRILGSSPLVAAPAAPSLSYTKGSATPAFVDLALSSTASASAAFSVDPTTLPAWLSVDAATGSLPKTLRFTTTGAADAMIQGTYSAVIRLQTPGFGNLAVAFSLAVGNPPPKLSVAEGTTRNLSWTVGQPLPIVAVTLISSDSPVPYTLVPGGTLSPAVGSGFLKGLAYSYGTGIPVTFDPAVFQAAQAGDLLSGSLTVTWGSPATTTVITINLSIQPAAATVLAVTPPSLPTAAAGQAFTVALTGSGFVPGSDPARATTVGIVSGGSLVVDANIAASVINSSNIILTITVPAAGDSLLPFGAAGSGGIVKLGVCNPGGAVCTAATGTATLLITPNPVIQAVTSAAAFLQAVPPALPVVAPYDMISIFGASFCVSGGTGCTGGQLLYGAPDPTTARYSSSLTPDTADGVRRLLTVVFQTHATPPIRIATAPLLFATNRQINLLVPAVLSTYIGKTVDIVVNFGPSSAASASEPFPVRVAAADPGVFTIETDGQGEGAILGTDWSIITAGNEAAVRANPADSDTVQIYMTGLGSPDSTANIASGGSSQWPGDCASIATYLTALNLQTGSSSSSPDGVLIEGTILNGNHLPPCLSAPATIPTVTVGGQPATVTYAGWVPGSVAGQYQVNVKLPGSAAGTFISSAGTPIAPPLTAAMQLPVLVSARGLSSQAGVTMWVVPRLQVTAPAVLQNPAGALWLGSGNLVTASEGTPPYQYRVIKGGLPAGLTLDPATGAIAGTPPAAAKGSYLITVTVTDSAQSPLTGSTTFSLTVN
jgi:uncharacterized protein (TIGR03437 family)